LNYEAWWDLLRSRCGQYYSKGIEPAAFTGWVRPVSALGFTATDIGCNSHRVERTSRDVRLDGTDHYFVVFLVRGQLAMTHNDQARVSDPADRFIASILQPGFVPNQIGAVIC
jgi:AraC family transcriptional regulator, positive regulator of tynA and feaB